MWAGSFAVRTGDVAVGVRVDDATLLAALRDAFAPQLLDVADPPPYVSVQRNRDDGVGLLFEANCQVLRTRDPARLANGVAALLAELGDAPPPPGCVRVKATAVVVGGDAVLSPAGQRRDLDAARTLLAHRGATPLDSRMCVLDPSALEVVAVPALEAGRLSQALGAHGIVPSGADGEVGHERRAEPKAPHGRYRLRALLDPRDSSTATHAARLAEQILDGDLSSRLAVAARLAAHVPWQPMSEPGDLTGLVESVCGARTSVEPARR